MVTAFCNENEQDTFFSITALLEVLLDKVSLSCLLDISLDSLLDIRLCVLNSWRLNDASSSGLICRVPPIWNKKGYLILITRPSEVRGLKKSAKILTVEAKTVKTQILTQFRKKWLKSNMTTLNPYNSG